MPHHFLVKGDISRAGGDLRPGCAGTSSTSSTSQVEKAKDEAIRQGAASATAAAAEETAAALLPLKTPAKKTLPPTCPPTVAAQMVDPESELSSAEPTPTAAPASSSRLLHDLAPHTAVADPDAADVDAGADAAEVEVEVDSAARAVAAAVTDTTTPAVAAVEAQPKQASGGSTWLNVRLLAQRLRSALSCA